MTKDNIIDILKRKKKEAIKYSDEWANKPASNSQDKLMNECWSSWNDGQAKAFELAISIVSMLDNPHNRNSEKNKQKITMATKYYCSKYEREVELYDNRCLGCSLFPFNVSECPSRINLNDK